MKRVSSFQAHSSITDFIESINEVVSSGEKNLGMGVGDNPPTFLVVGAPRSGTTVLMQWLNEVGVSVPSNLSARFSGNPYFAGLLQRLLTDSELNYRDELRIPEESDQFLSDYGKTRGLLSPHEFSFFFRRYFPVTVGECLSEEELSKSDPEGFVNGLGLFGTALASPVAVKALLIQYHLDLMNSFPNVFILHVHRDPIENVCSLYRYRKIVAGDLNEWVSVRPPQYEKLKRMSPIEQVAGQVHFTNQEILNQLRHFPSDRTLSLSHEHFCNSPESLFNVISDFCLSHGYELAPYSGKEKFSIHAYDQRSETYSAARQALERVKLAIPS